MPLFGRKKEKTDELLAEIKQAVEQIQPKIEEKKAETKPTEFKEKPETKEERPSFAPLFVKLDRYKQILNSMNYLKTTLVMVKNSLIVLEELDKLRREGFNLIKDAMDKVEKKVLTLDSEFLRPSGFHEELPELHDVESLAATVESLKTQIEQLKTEVESLA